MTVFPQPKLPQELIHTPVQNTLRKPAERTHELQMLPAAEMRVEMCFLGHVSYAPLKRDDVVPYVLALKEDLSFCRFDEARQNLDGCALACSVRTEIAHDFARADRKADVVDDPD